DRGRDRDLRVVEEVDPERLRGRLLREEEQPAVELVEELPHALGRHATPPAGGRAATATRATARARRRRPARRRAATRRWRRPSGAAPARTRSSAAGRRAKTR